MKLLIISLLASALLGTHLCQAAGSETPRSFLRGIYAHYADESSDFDPTGDAAGGIFDPRLLFLIRQDQAVPAGEEGWLDSDPICACQDFANFRLRKISIEKKGYGEVLATVDFENDGAKKRVTYDLVRITGHWKIRDIKEPGIPSLRMFLALHH